MTRSPNSRAWGCPAVPAAATLALTLAITAGTAGAGEPLATNVVQQFERLAHHPDPMAINLGVGSDASLCMHYQGLNRHTGPDGSVYMFLSRSGNRTISCPFDSNTPGEIAVARLDSRPRHGERLRSNRLEFNRSQKDTAAPSGDRIVTSIRTDGQNGRPSWMHHGGMQIIDDMLIIPAEDAWPDGSDTGALLFYDISDPENPLLVHEVPFGFKIGVCAVTQNTQTGQYVIAVGGGDTRTLYFYETLTDDLTQPTGIDWSQPFFVYDVDAPTVPASVRDEWEEFQSINFVRQNDGQLYMVALDNTSFTNLEDDSVAVLFRYSRSGSNITFTHVARREFKFTDPTSGNGAAGASVYVSPLGEMIIYASELDNDGPDGSIRMAEVRSYNGSYVTNGLDMSSDFWVELYEDDNGWNENSPNRSLMLDEADFALENWEDLDEEDGWGDSPDSLRFYAPPGRDILLFKDQNFSGDFHRLTGNGLVQSITDLDAIGFGDSIHSVFIGRFRVPLGAEVFGQYQALRAFSTGLSYNGSRELAFLGGANLVLAPLEASPGETIFLTTQPGTTTLLVGQ